MNRVPFILRSIALALGATLLLANAEPEDEGEICLAIGHIWRGDSEDIKRIRSIPVPDSYRRYFEEGGCTRFQLIEQSLIDWNLAFGDEHTTTLALAYLESEYRKGVPGPEDFGAGLSAALQDARRTIEAAKLPRTGDPKRNARERRVRNSPSVQRAVKAAGAYSQYVELAGAYIRAAEIYGSASLLEKAELYFAPAQAGAATLVQAETQLDPSLGDFVQLSPRRSRDVPDLEMRIPILRARLSRSAQHLDSAAATMTRRYEPVFETAADNARDHSGEFCELNGDTKSEEIRALELACDDEHSLRIRTVDFWRNRAHLDLLMAGDPAHFEPVPYHRPVAGSDFVRRSAPAGDAKPAGSFFAFGTAAWLLRNRGVKERSELPPPLDGYGVDLFSLLLARSEMHARWSSGPGGDPGEIGLALDYAAQAARLVPPHDAPALFKRAGEAWLALWARAAMSDEAAHLRRGDRSRFAVYLRTSLASLDAIAPGEAGDAPRSQ